MWGPSLFDLEMGTVKVDLVLVAMGEKTEYSSLGLLSVSQFSFFFSLQHTIHIIIVYEIHSSATVPDPVTYVHKRLLTPHSLHAVVH